MSFNVRGPQTGFGLIAVMALILLGASASYIAYGFKETQQLAVQRGYKNLAAEINDLHAAALQFYRDTQRFPSDMAELASAGRWPGKQTTPYGGTYGFSTVTHASGAETFTITLTTPSDRHARAAASLVPNGQANVAVLSSTIRAPFQNEIYADYLQRHQDALRPEMTTLETAINVGNNNLNSVDEFTARYGDIDRMVVTDLLQSQNISTSYIGFGAANNPSIRHRNGHLVLDATDTQTTGGLTIGGSLNAQGNNITGVGDLNANQVIASVGQIDNITGVNINYVQGTVNILSGQQINYVTGTINAISGVQLNYTNGTVTTLTGNNLNYNSGTIGTLSGNSFNYSTGYAGTLSGNTLTYNSGSIGSLSGNTLTYNSGSIGSLSGNTLTYNAGQFGSITANTASFNDAWIATIRGNNLQYGTGIISNVSGTTATFGHFTGINFSGNSATWQQLTVNGHTTFNTVDSNSYVTGTYTADQISVDNIELNSLTTGQIISAISSLGAASASEFTVAGQITSGSINTGSLTANTGSINTLSGSVATFDTFNGNVFRGGTFYGDNFVARTGDENQIRYDLDRRKAELDNCMYVTQYCFGQPPTLNISCVNCTWSKADSNFSATITVNISNCPSGCNYSWSMTGVTGSCPAGAVAAGASQTVNCTVTGTIAASESVTGAVSLTASNAKRPQKASSQSASISWRNSSPAAPPFWEQVVAGCYVDTLGQDVSTPNTCDSMGDRMGTQAGILFSVGTQFSGEVWSFAESGVTVMWAGACNGSGSQCVIQGSCAMPPDGGSVPVCPALGKRTATATVNYQGVSRTYTVYADDQTRDNSGPVE